MSSKSRVIQWSVIVLGVFLAVFLLLHLNKPIKLQVPLINKLEKENFENGVELKPLTNDLREGVILAF